MNITVVLAGRVKVHERGVLVDFQAIGKPNEDILNLSFSIEVQGGSNRVA
jgi:hypothetical protein